MGLLFRFGFACVAAGAEPDGDEVWAEVVGEWRRTEADGLVILHDPETTVLRRDGAGATAVLIGDAFTVPATLGLDAALDALLAADPESDAFFEALDALSGRFVVLVLNGRVRRAFHDPIGSRSVFYRADGELCLSSHAELVARAFGRRRSRQARRVLDSDEFASRSVKYLPGDLTRYRGVRGLAPNNFYDLAARRTGRYWPRRRRRAGDFSDLFTAVDEHLGALAAHLREGHAPFLGVTAGIDTRTMIAALRHHGAPFRGVTWLRRGAVSEREREVIEAVAGHAGIEHSYLELGRPGPEERAIAAAARRNMGRFGSSSRITARLHGLIGGPGAVFVRGYGAEIMRGFYNLSEGASTATQANPLRARLRRLAGAVGRGASARPSAIGELTAPELLRAYESSMRMTEGGAEHTRIGLAAFSGFMARANYDERLAAAGFDLSDVFYWEHRMGMWGSVKHNEMDPAALSIAGFNSRRVYEAAFALEPRERLTKELLRRVIARYDPDLAEIPYL